MELYRSGMTCTGIEKSLGINRRSVYRILNRKSVQLVRVINNECDICGGPIKNNPKNRTRCAPCQVKLRRYMLKAKAVDFKGGKCQRCGWSGSLCGYDFHHMDPSKKRFLINAKTMTTHSWDKIVEELNNCELLCAICHRIEHSDYKNETMLKLIGIKREKHWEKKIAP